MKLPDIIPWWWKAGAVLVIAAGLAAGAAAYRHHVYQLGFDAAVDQRAARDLVGVVARVQENAVTASLQKKINLDITKAKDEELAPVVQRIYVDRVRIGKAICDGPAAAAETASAGGGGGTDPSGGVVRDDLDRDLKALMLAVEQDLATGRACQMFVRENGLTP